MTRKIPRKITRKITPKITERLETNFRGDFSRRQGEHLQRKRWISTDLVNVFPENAVHCCAHVEETRFKIRPRGVCYCECRTVVVQNYCLSCALLSSPMYMTNKKVAGARQRKSTKRRIGHRLGWTGLITSVAASDSTSARRFFSRRSKNENKRKERNTLI